MPLGLLPSTAPDDFLKPFRRIALNVFPLIALIFANGGAAVFGKPMDVYANPTRDLDNIKHVAVGQKWKLEGKRFGGPTWTRTRDQPVMSRWL